MSTPGMRAINPYDSVIADLRSKRDELDKTIAMLERLRGERLGDVPAPAEPPAEPENPTGQFLGMTIPDATKQLLRMRKRTMGNAEILKELQAGGLVLTSADKMNVIGSVLTRRFHVVGDIVRVSRGVWGLKEWYPGRSFKPTIKPENIEQSLHDDGGSLEIDDDHSVDLA